MVSYIAHLVGGPLDGSRAGIGETKPVTLHVTRSDADGFYTRGAPSAEGSHEIEFAWVEREEWRAVPSYPDYEASSAGRIRRATPGKGTHVGRIVGGSIDAEGYPTLGTTNGPRRLHVLVAEAFLGPIPEGGEVHHVNENREDPRPSNLEISASRLAHGERHRKPGSNRRRAGEDNPAIGCACGCGRTFSKYDRGGRPRRFVSGHNTGARNRGEVVGSRG